MYILSFDELDIKPSDLDILGHNSHSEVGDDIADWVERISNDPGLDDNDGLGTNELPPELKE